MLSIFRKLPRVRCLIFTKNTKPYTPLYLSQLAKSYHRPSKTERREMISSVKFDPPVNRSMTELDRSFFQKEVNLLVACFPEPKYLGKFVKECKDDILYLPSIKHIVQVDEKTKGVLLRPDIKSVDDVLSGVSDITKNKIEEYGLQIKDYKLKLTYDFWKADDILRAILPVELLDDIPSGFAQAGHVAHLNLKEEFKKYGGLIGQVILDKNPKVETVVDKLDTIDTKFRTFKMHVIAGKDDLMVEQQESGCRFAFDFSKVYWNSRLSTEHERLVASFQPETAVGDVFAGVGPFALPAAKKNVFVLANDLNPLSYEYLNQNVKLNSTQNFVKTFNDDGREFIRNSPRLMLDWANNVKKVEKKKPRKKRRVDPSNATPTENDVESINIPMYISNYVMNLPDSALTFLDEFVGLYSDQEVSSVLKSLPDFKLPIINVHCFEKYSPEEKPEPSQETLQKRVHERITKIMSYNVPYESMHFHVVRKVAPTKPMFCVSFELPYELAFRK